MTPKKRKNGPQKLLIIGPDPFIPQSSPGHSPQPKIDFYILKSRDQTSVLLSVLISITFFIWYIKVHNIPSSLLSLTSLSSHLKHPIILIFVKLAQFSQYMHCNPFLHHAMLAPFQSYLNFLETLDCL